MTMEYPVSRAQSAAYILLLAAISAIVYYPGISGDFLLDDLANIVDNESLRLDSLNVASIREAAFSSDAGILHRPVSMLSFAANYFYFGADPLSFKVFNLLIHLLNGIGLYVLANAVLGAHKNLNAPELPAKQLKWLVFWVSAAWILHPVNLTSVLYVVQRMTSLSSFFMIVGLNLYVLGRIRRVNGDGGMALILASAVPLPILAILSKENGALLPLYILVIELAIFRFRTSSGRIDRAIASLFTAILIIPAATILLWLFVDPSAFLGGYEGRNFTLAERLLTQMRVLVFYLHMTLLPNAWDLGLYHDDISLSHSLIDPASTLFSAFLLLGLVTSAFLLLRKHAVIALGLLWFFCGHLLESTILPLEIAHEHRNYLASFGILLATGYILIPGLLSWNSKSLRYGVATVSIMGLALITTIRADQWRNSTSHALVEAEHHPNSARAIYSASRIHANLVLNGSLNNPDTTLALMDRAIQLDTITIMPNAAAAIFCARLNLAPCIDWQADAEETLSSHPVTPGSKSSLQGLVECAREACKDIAPTLTKLIQSALNNPKSRNYPDLYADLLNLYGQHMMYLNNDFAAAMPHFRLAVAAAPQNPLHRLNLARLLVFTGHTEEAGVQLLTVRTLDKLGRHSSDIQQLEHQIHRTQPTYQSRDAEAASS